MTTTILQIYSKASNQYNDVLGNYNASKNLFLEGEISMVVSFTNPCFLFFQVIKVWLLNIKSLRGSMILVWSNFGKFLKVIDI